eukprot:2031468-Prymnesium_polylepis.1
MAAACLFHQLRSLFWVLQPANNVADGAPQLLLDEQCDPAWRCGQPVLGILPLEPAAGVATRGGLAAGWG